MIISHKLLANSLRAVATVENTAAAKIFFETYYNEATSTQLTPRSMRRRDLEISLYQNCALTPTEKDEKRIFWARTESDHLRETRSMKNRDSKTLQSKTAFVSRYEVVKVLGKGSFGVVRLVREKTAERYVDVLVQEHHSNTDMSSSFRGAEKKDIYAMKVIRKSEMLRNSQEGHLRAERDFLVAAEGSRWYAE